MEKRFNLSMKEILEKEFHIDLKGYNANEVDSFLDFVISDYQNYDELLTQSREHLTKFEEENRRLKNRISELEMQVSNKEAISSVPTDNLDVLKRLSRLEKAVFKENSQM